MCASYSYSTPIRIHLTWPSLPTTISPVCDPPFSTNTAFTCQGSLTNGTQNTWWPEDTIQPYPPNPTYVSFPTNSSLTCNTCQMTPFSLTQTTCV